MAPDDSPTMFEAVWSRAQIEQLFADLSLGAHVEHVQVRTDKSGSGADRATTLQDAHRLIREHQAKAVQIRYTFDNDRWCDTLMMDVDTVRIVRTKLSTTPTDSESVSGASGHPDLTP